jgi:hypothetical protein
MRSKLLSRGCERVENGEGMRGGQNRNDCEPAQHSYHPISQDSQANVHEYFDTQTPNILSLSMQYMTVCETRSQGRLHQS